VSQENLEVPRRLIDAYTRGDIPSFLDLLDADVEWIPIMAALEGRTYRGREGVLRWLEEPARHLEYFEPQYEEYRDLGDQVLILGRWRARGRASGVELENQPATWLYEIKGGKAVRMRTFTDRAEALEAAGLSEQDAHSSTSQEKVELVRRFEKCWARQDLDAALEFVHDDLEFDWSDSRGPFVGTYKGRDGLTRFWAEMLEAWEEFIPEMEEIVDCGPERLLTLDLVRARGKGSGIDMEARGAMLWTVQEGKIIRVKMFQSMDEALEAVGLSE
jgi:ketosteroid isomerase-like protein